ncbi:GDSL-type esterase/lipase family protein [Streptomyces sp. NPDC008313]|uniref:GDSL-type esterase/lipase family protein n=1 Tax=Streptomyces sp. NPDC008313 TaxID=3364826 RepID=UPI0036E69474
MIEPAHRRLPLLSGVVFASVLACASLQLAAPPRAAAIEGGVPAYAAADTVQIWKKGSPGDPDRYICAGTITAAYKIVTATHCFINAPVDGSGRYYARAGDVVLGGGEKYIFEKMASRGDLAVVTTSLHGSPLPTRRVAKLGPNKRVPRKKILYSFGWGLTSASSTVPSRLLKRALTSVNDNEEGLRDGAKPGGGAYQVRAIGAKLRSGDSGGPSGYYVGGNHYLTGVTSTSDVTNGNAKMSATYDMPGCNTPGAVPCVYDWLKIEADMQVANGHDELRRRSISVMPLGDSITDGFKSTNGAGYRSRLYGRLNESTRDVDFVGTQHSGRTVDPDHEGYSGMEIDYVAGRAKSAVPLSHPSVVTLHLGTNDVDRGTALPSAPDRLGGLVDQILKDSPNSTVLVATLVPSKDANVQARIDTYNDGVAEEVMERAEAGKHVSLVDMNEVTTTDLADTLHPNDGGYDKMADAWFDAIAGVAESGWLEDTGSGDTCSDQRGGWIPQGQIASGVGVDRPNVRFADIDGDGRDDYLAVDPGTGAVRAWMNTGGDANGKPGWNPRGQIASGTNPGELEYVDFADINGDGRDDYLLRRNDGAIRAWINAGGDVDGKPGWIPRGQIAAGVGNVTDGRRLADIDGDKDADYLIVEGNGAIHAWINVGGDRDGQPGWIDGGKIASGIPNPSRILFANINCDKRADYLNLSSVDGSVDAWVNTGGDSDGKPGWIAQGQIASGNVGDPDGVQFADIDGDGRDDYLVVTAETGVVHAWINKGGDPA